MPRRRKNPMTRPSGSVGSVVNVANAIGHRNIPVVAPSFSAGDRGSVRVHHRECLGALTSPGGEFNIVGSFPIQPASPLTFPWLCHLANMFETYEFRSLRFQFQTLSSTNTAGIVVSAIDYDAADPAPFALADMLSMQGAVQCSMWLSQTHNALPYQLRGKRFVRPAALLNNLDIKTYDVGNFFIGCYAVNAGYGLGTLFVEYDIVLHTPVANGIAIASEGAAVIQGDTVGASSSAPLGTHPSYFGGIPLFLYNNGFKFLQAGQYIVSMIMQSTGTSTPPTISLTNGSKTATDFETAETGGAVGQWLISASLGCILTIAGWTGITSMKFRVMRYASSLNNPALPSSSSSTLSSLAVNPSPPAPLREEIKGDAPSDPTGRMLDLVSRIQDDLEDPPVMVSTHASTAATQTVTGVSGGSRASNGRPAITRGAL